MAEVGGSTRTSTISPPLPGASLQTPRVDKGIIWLIPEASVEAETLLGGAASLHLLRDREVGKLGGRLPWPLLLGTASMAQPSLRGKHPPGWLLLHTQPPPSPGGDGLDHLAPGY